MPHAHAHVHIIHTRTHTRRANARVHVPPGKNYVHQLKLILNLFGAPSSEEIEMVAGTSGGTESHAPHLTTDQHRPTPPKAAQRRPTPPNATNRNQRNAMQQRSAASRTTTQLETKPSTWHAMPAGKNGPIRDFLTAVQNLPTPAARDISTRVESAARELVTDDGVDLLRQMLRFRYAGSALRWSA